VLQVQCRLQLWQLLQPGSAGLRRQRTGGLERCLRSSSALVPLLLRGHMLTYRFFRQQRCFRLFLPPTHLRGQRLIALQCREGSSLRSGLMSPPAAVSQQ
jgi:hypothetical protein